MNVTAADPRLLVHLKAYRNTVPVPRHWCHKRKYLQGKRGVEKPPFQLPGRLRCVSLSIFLIIFGLQIILLTLELLKFENLFSKMSS